MSKSTLDSSNGLEAPGKGVVTGQVIAEIMKRRPE